MESLRDLLKKASVPEPLELLLGQGEAAVWGIRVEAALLLPRWERLHDQGGTLVPVILGDDLEPHRDALALDGRTLPELLEAAARTPPVPRQWLLDAGAEGADLDAELAELHGPMAPSPTPTEELELSVGEGPLAIALLPGPDADAPLHLRFGAGASPLPEQHAALLRAWASAYGARVVALTGVELAVRVERPPSSLEDALRLAEAQALYAGHLLGAESLEELAARLRVDRVWHFRWDAEGDAD